MPEYNPPRLSPEARAELTEIIQAEMDESLSDVEVEEIGTRLLTLFSILRINPIVEKPEPLALSDQEAVAFSFISAELKKRKPPSARQVSLAVGLRSPRSGFRLIQSLIRKGLLARCEHGLLCHGE